MKGNTRIWVAMVLIFVSGVAVGFFGSGLIIRDQVRDFMRRGPGPFNARKVERILSGMDLSDKQIERITEIVEGTSLEIRKNGAEFGKSIDSLATQQYDSIKAILTDEQAEIFEQRIQRDLEERQRIREHRDEWRKRRPERRDHPRFDPPGAI